MLQINNPITREDEKHSSLSNARKTPRNAKCAKAVEIRKGTIKDFSVLIDFAFLLIPYFTFADESIKYKSLRRLDHGGQTASGLAEVRQHRVNQLEGLINLLSDLGAR